MKRLKLGIIGGGPGSWIGHVHRIASRFDDKYEIVAGVFSRNYKINQSFGTSIGIKKHRCYKNYKAASNLSFSNKVFPSCSKILLKPMKVPTKH